MRGGGLLRLLGAYLALGSMWCLVVNLYAAVVGTTSAFSVLGGTMSTADKVIATLRIIGGQVLLWPVDFYRTVLQPLLG